jgi:hypothetical protein
VPDILILLERTKVLKFAAEVRDVVRLQCGFRTSA